MQAPKPRFTHFFSIPLIRPETRTSLSDLQKAIVEIFKEKGLEKHLKPNDVNQFHLTINMLDLASEDKKKKIVAAVQAHKAEFQELMKNVKFTADRIQHFAAEKENQRVVTVIFLDIKKDQNYQKLKSLSDKLMKICIKEGIVLKEQLKGMFVEYDAEKDFYKNQSHITLFRGDGLIQNDAFKECFAKIENLHVGHSLPCDSVDVSQMGKFDETKFYYPYHRTHFVKHA